MNMNLAERIERAFKASHIVEREWSDQDAAITYQDWEAMEKLYDEYRTRMGFGKARTKARLVWLEQLLEGRVPYDKRG
jgi:hypothetical protein